MVSEAPSRSSRVRSVAECGRAVAVMCGTLRSGRLRATETQSIGSNVQLTRPLDGIDRNIVALLQENAKRTFADIGAEVGLSATAVKRRVDRLERDGVILGYGVRVNWRALGEAIESLIEIYCADRTSPADVGRSLATVQEIISAFTVSGEADAVIRVRVDSIDHLERLVERLRRDPNIVRTRTLIVLSTLLDRA
ncbi:MAG TPA: Lrp/AsnC family transcriptional regulator [Solirubrobacteraceae bacterium]